MPGRIAMKRAQLRAQADTRPGQILLLSLLAAAPIALAFVLFPVVLGATNVWLIRLALVATPLFAAWSLVVYARTPSERRAHNAARMGVTLDATSLGLWVLILVPALMGRV